MTRCPKVGQLQVWLIWQLSNISGDQGPSSSYFAIFSGTPTLMVVKMPEGFQVSHPKQQCPEVKGLPFPCALFSHAKIFLRSPPAQPSKLPLTSLWPELARPETISRGNCWLSLACRLEFRICPDLGTGSPSQRGRPKQGFCPILHTSEKSAFFAGLPAHPEWITVALLWAVPQAHASMQPEEQ